jgi:hypothetical protein
MSSEMTKGLSYEEAHAAKPVGYIFEANTTGNDLGKSVEKHITLGEPQRPDHVGVYHHDVVASLKGQIAVLEEQLSGHKQAFENMRTKYEAERQRQFTEPGWFFPRVWIADEDAEHLNDTIDRTKRAPTVVLQLSGHNIDKTPIPAHWIKVGFEVKPEPVKASSVEATTAIVLTKRWGTLFEAIKHGDEAHQEWLKEAIAAHFEGRPVPEVVMKSEAAQDQSWVVKFGAAIARYQDPIIINGLKNEALDEVYQRLMKQLGQPQSHSLLSALKQLTLELTFGSAKVIDVVQLVEGHMQAHEVFWGDPVTPKEGSALHAVAAEKLLGNPELQTRKLGVQAGVVYRDGGRLRFYDMGDTYPAELEVFNVYFEEGKCPPEFHPAFVTKEMVGLGSSPADILVTPREVQYKSTSFPAAGTVHAVAGTEDQDHHLHLPVEEEKPSLSLFVRELTKYEDHLDVTIDAFVSSSIFRSEPEYMTQLKAVIKDHFVRQWKADNVDLIYADENDCQFPKSNGKCCQRNRELGNVGCHLTGEQAVKAIRTHLGLAPSSTNMPGVQDNSVHSVKHLKIVKPPVFGQDALRDPTNLQKALIMGMVGSDSQKQEAREFLTQSLRLGALDSLGITPQ